MIGLENIGNNQDGPHVALGARDVRWLGLTTLANPHLVANHVLTASNWGYDPGDAIHSKECNSSVRYLKDALGEWREWAVKEEKKAVDTKRVSLAARMHSGTPQSPLLFLLPTVTPGDRHLHLEKD